MSLPDTKATVLRVRNTDELLAVIENYRKKFGVTASRFGWNATGDLSLVSKLRHKAGYDPHMSTVNRILEYIENNTTGPGDDGDDFAEGLDE